MPEEYLDKVPILEAKDVADAVVYALSTPPHIEVRILYKCIALHYYTDDGLYLRVSNF